MLVNFNKTKMIQAVIVDINETFQKTLDTLEFVPDKEQKVITKNIINTLKQNFKLIDKEDRYYQKRYKKYYKKIQKEKTDKEVKISLGIKEKQK